MEKQSTHNKPRVPRETSGRLFGAVRPAISPSTPTHPHGAPLYSSPLPPEGGREGNSPFCCEKHTKHTHRGLAQQPAHGATEAALAWSPIITSPAPASLHFGVYKNIARACVIREQPRTIYTYARLRLSCLVKKMTHWHRTFARPDLLATQHKSDKESARDPLDRRLFGAQSLDLDLLFDQFLAVGR